MPLAGPPLTQPNPIDRLLARGLETKPDEVALFSLRTALTWRELDEQSTHLAREYLALGLQSGDRIASLMPNRPALVVHYLACLKAGLVATPLNYRYMPPEIDHALEVSGASILLHHAERDVDVAASRIASRLPRGAIRYRAAEAPNDQRLRFEALMDRPRSATPLPTPDLDAPTFIYFTSGSTGKPKGVTHTRRTFGMMMASAIEGILLSDADVTLPCSSLSHIMGSFFCLTTLAVGARLLVSRGTTGPEVLPLLEEHPPTVLVMLPAALIALVRDHNAGRRDFASIRLCTAGGDKVSQELENEFAALAGFAVDESYGMTEIGMATINPPAGENRLGSIGKLCPGFELSLRDDAGRELPAGSEGRLWVRTPTNMVGYWNRPDATAETIVDGWLDTGDVMRVDADGYLWFCGRKKQIIVHDGSNICPQEVEEAIADHPAVDAVGVIGIHDLVHGENVRAYVTLKPGAARPTSAELIAHARTRVGYKAPEEIDILDKMPLNASGKVDRVALKQLAESRLCAIPTGGERKSS